jgi:hypothetical protein
MRPPGERSRAVSIVAHPARRSATPTEFPTVVRSRRRNCRSNYLAATRRPLQYLSYRQLTIPVSTPVRIDVHRPPFISTNRAHSPAPLASVCRPAAGQRNPRRRRSTTPTHANGSPPISGPDIPAGNNRPCPPRSGPFGRAGRHRPQRRHFSANRTAAVPTDPDLGIVHAMLLADRRRRATFRQ